jgi:hypothetical protein
MGMADELERPQVISILSAILSDNTTTSKEFSIGGSPPRELGNEITLAVDTPRWANEFYFGYVAGLEETTGNVRFYMNDGPHGAPGTLFFQSESVELKNIGTKTLSLGRVSVPNKFTWTLAYSGPSDAALGLLEYGPPTIGLCNNFIWYQQGGTA